MEKALETGGYKKAKTELYLKESTIPMMKEKIWEIISGVRNIIRKTTGGG